MATATKRDLMGEVRACERVTLKTGDTVYDIDSALEERLFQAGICPECAPYGEAIRLREQREGCLTLLYCPQCELEAPKPSGYEREPDYGGAFDGFQVVSDADPGL